MKENLLYIFLGAFHSKVDFSHSDQCDIRRGNFRQDLFDQLSFGLSTFKNSNNSHSRPKRNQNSTQVSGKSLFLGSIMYNKYMDIIINKVKGLLKQKRVYSMPTLFSRSKQFELNEICSNEYKPFKIFLYFKKDKLYTKNIYYCFWRYS